MWEKLLGVAFALLAVMLVGLTLFVGLGVGAYVWDEHPPSVIALAGGGAAVAVFILRRRARSPGHPGNQQPARIHPGISIHALPIAGGMGIVFAMGYVVMFWFGAPGYRPIVLCAAALGALLGTLLIWSRGRSGRDRGGASILHLNT